MLLDYAFPLAIGEQERGPDHATRRTVEAVGAGGRGSRILFNTTGHGCAFLRGSRFGGISAFDNARTLHARHRLPDLTPQRRPGFPDRHRPAAAGADRA